jgi:hypothetical protein
LREYDKLAQQCAAEGVDHPRYLLRLAELELQLMIHKLLIIDELGYVPLSTTGAELLFEVFSQRYERGPISSLPICRLMNGLACSDPRGYGN